LIENKIKVLFASSSYPTDENDWRGRFTANIVEAISNNNELSFGAWVPPGKLPPNVHNLTIFQNRLIVKAAGMNAHVCGVHTSGAIFR